MPDSASLYFHLPFCHKKCPYCHFYVTKVTDELSSTLKTALHLEWKRRLPLIQGKKLASIYFGGGTPTQLPPSFIEDLLTLIQKTHTLPKEITLEANPEDITLDLLKTYRDLGINRLSIGVQSFDDPTLKSLGRTHNSKSASDSIHTATRAGFDNITIDLMYDLPNQTLQTWKKTLLHTKTLPVSHISLYNLTFEEPSAFHRKQKTLLPLIPSEDTSYQMLTSAINTFEAMNLPRYEISAFGRPSIHNTGYWTGRPFLGYGPSAFSYWDKSRFRNIAHLKKYAAALTKNEPCEDFTEKLSPDAHQREMLAVNLRLLKGVDLPTFEKNYNALTPALKADIEKLISENYLESDHLKLTEKGLLFYDTVASTLV